MTGRRREASTRGHSGRRSAARLAAIQALYQIDAIGASADDTIEEFLHHRHGATTEGGSTLEIASDWFAKLVRGVCSRREEIDMLIAGALTDGWTLSRLERLLLAVLRAGVFELLANTEVPARVAIDEYVEVARAFFGRGEPGFVNGVLDCLARDLRSAEFTVEDGAR